VYVVVLVCQSFLYITFVETVLFHYLLIPEVVRFEKLQSDI